MGPPALILATKVLLGEPLGADRAGPGVGTAADDGPDALERAAYDRPDLILLDLRMPTVDGIRLIEILRGNALTMRTPIVLMSAADKEWATRRLLPDPIVRFIEKPLDFDALDGLCASLLVPPALRAEGFPS